MKFIAQSLILGSIIAVRLESSPFEGMAIQTALESFKQTKDEVDDHKIMVAGNSDEAQYIKDGPN